MGNRTQNIKRISTIISIFLCLGWIIFTAVATEGFSIISAEPAEVKWQFWGMIIGGILIAYIVPWSVSRLMISGVQRKTILMVGLFAIVLTGLFAPWTYTYQLEGIYSEEPAGYYYIGTPPNKKRGGAQYGVKLDTPRLLLQWVVVIAISGGGVLLFEKQKNKEIG